MSQPLKRKDSNKLAAKVLNEQTPLSSETQTSRKQELKSPQYYTNISQPVEDLDDEDGYLKVESGHHILNRFEVLSVLGKGSFA